MKKLLFTLALFLAFSVNAQTPQGNYSAYKQLTPREPDRTAEYIQKSVDRLVKEDRQRRILKREKEEREEEIRVAYLSLHKNINSWITYTGDIFKRTTEYLDSKNIDRNRQKPAIEKYYLSLDQIANYYNDNRNSLDPIKVELIKNKLLTLDEEWAFSVKYGDINILLTEADSK